MKRRVWTDYQNCPTITLKLLQSNIYVAKIFGVFHSSICRRISFVNAGVKLRLKQA